MIRCTGGKEYSFTEKVSSSPYGTGNYSARVRAITPAGNGSWSDVVHFSLRREEEESTSKMKSRRFFFFEIAFVAGARMGREKGNRARGEKEKVAIIHIVRY